MIETLDDIIEELADKFGLYGIGPEEGDHPADCKCRICFCAWLKRRIEKAVEKKETIKGTMRTAGKVKEDLEIAFAHRIDRNYMVPALYSTVDTLLDIAAWEIALLESRILHIEKEVERNKN